jgi:hypothetical protein
MKASDFKLRSEWLSTDEGETFVAVAKAVSGRVIATAQLQVSMAAQDFMDHFGDGREQIETAVLDACREAALRFPG